MTGALGFLTLILLLVCAMLLAILAKPKKKWRPQIQSCSGDGHGPNRFYMTSSNSLSYHDNTEAVTMALKEINARKNENTPEKRWTAGDNVYNESTCESYVSILSILDAKRSQRSKHLHSMDETQETYEDMDVTASDTIRSQRVERLHSLDETWEKYEDMVAPMDMGILTDMNRLRGDKSFHSLDKGWEEGMGCIPMYYNVFEDGFEDTYDSDELYDDTVLDKQLNGHPARQTNGKSGHERYQNMDVVKKSAAVATTDSIQEHCGVHEAIYDDIKYVDEIYEVVPEVVSDGQPDKYPARRTDGQSIKQPPRQLPKPSVKQQAKWSVNQQAKWSVNQPVKWSVNQPAKWSVKQPAKWSVNQPAKRAAGLSAGQGANKCPSRQTDGLSLGKPPMCYQALCPPHALADIPNQYTKLCRNQGHRALMMGRPPSHQYSSVREPSHRTGANGEARPLSRQYSSLREPSHSTGERGEARPPSHQYSSVREPPHSTGERGEARPPSHQYSSVIEPPHSTGERGAWQCLHYI